MRQSFTRRHFMKVTAAAAAAASAANVMRAYAQRAAQPAHEIAPGPFKGTWESLVANYQTPDWFRDAKFGIWPIGPPNASPSGATGTHAKCTSRGRPITTIT